MPTYLQPALLPHPHHNHFLFSDYYLEKRVHEHRDWRAASQEAQAAMEEITHLWQRVRPNDLALNESQTEQEWIRPVLDILGHHYNVQVSLQTPYGIKKPDYLFYPDSAALQIAHQQRAPLRDREIAPALAVGDAKAWNVPLDRAVPAAQDPTRQVSANPGVQIDFYIRHSGLAWGILTNGRLWRLYHRESSRKLDVYYEVDLAALLEQPDPEHFKYFYLFFRRDAFATDWLEEVLTSSRTYEKGVSDDLKEQVYEALRALAQGFLDFPGNRLSPTPDALKLIYDNSLIVLYRLLFILYAESRGLLPLNENAAYTESYSLDALKKRIVAEMHLDRPAVASMPSLWSALLPLWQVLDAGNEQLGVPAYNGGLFNPEKHPFLERYKVGDLHLRRAIDLLARAEDPLTGSREFVDYRDLAIRHLGSIYEGLLEYHLLVTDAGAVELRTDKGERKATGSYYTPDYIVQYIVEESIGPLIDELVQRHGDDRAALVQAILSLNILDPAAGSGHFLVGATEYLAHRLVEVAAGMIEGMEGEGEVAYWRRRVAQSCIYGVDLNPLAVELAKLSLWLATVAKDRPLNFLDHHLRPGNSLIGARVEALRPNAPKRVTSRKERVAQEAGQQSMLEEEEFLAAMQGVTGLMGRIEAMPTDTLAEVHEAERLYQEQVRVQTRKYRTLADVWSARFFGLEVDGALWEALVQHTLRGGFAVPHYEAILAQGRSIAQSYRFFHWDLEFPEVFFDEQGQSKGEQGGFDVVMGNPPYGATLAREQASYFSGRYSLQSYQLDTYLLFIEQGLELLRSGGYWGMIIPNTWLLNLYSHLIRDFIFGHLSVMSIVHYQRPVFPGVAVDTEISLFRKKQASREHQINISIVGKDEQNVTYTIDQERWRSLEGKPVNIFEKPEFVELIDKLRLLPSLGDFLHVTQGAKPFQVGKGKPPQTEQTVKEQPYVALTAKDATFVPLLRGSLIERYHILWNGDYWISFGDWLAEPRHSANYYAAEKIVIRQTGDSLIAALDRKQFVVRDNLYTIVSLDDRIDLLYTLALLNSSLLNWFYQKVVNPEAGEALAQVKRGHILQLPLVTPAFFTMDAERAQGLADAQHLYEQSLATHDASALLAFVEAQFAQERADIIHDLLAWLAAQMIDLHQRKQSTLEDFWLDLEGVTDSSTFTTLRHKGKQEASLWKAEPCRPFVAEQSRATRTLDESLGWSEEAFKAFLRLLVGSVANLSQVIRIYRQHAPMYLATSRQIARTDHLIDQIVYRLYGLSDEEIAIVEA